MKITTLFFAVYALISFTMPAMASDAPIKVPVPGMITMVDLGAHKCIPCKMMAPILEKLSKEYEGKAAIIFIDVWENKDQSRKFGIRAIPTQIFYDKEGKELYRHQGFMAEEAIISQFESMGVQSPTKKLSN